MNVLTALSIKSIEMRIKANVIAALRKLLLRRGYYLVAGWKLQELPLVNHLKKTFELHNVNLVLDVGGNKGQYAQMLREDVGYDGSIISFEPVSTYAKELADLSDGDENWDVCPYALGSKNETKNINVTRSPGLNSFLSPCSDEVQGFWKDGDMVGSEKVQIRRLDDVLDHIPSAEQSNIYLKLDTQGFDLEVLRGAPRWIKRMRALQTEASIKAIYSDMPGYQDTLQILDEYGFEISGMYPITLDTALRMIEFDCVAVNSRFCDLNG